MLSPENKNEAMARRQRHTRLIIRHWDGIALSAWHTYQGLGRCAMKLTERQLEQIYLEEIWDFCLSYPHGHPFAVVLEKYNPLFQVVVVIEERPNQSWVYIVDTPSHKIPPSEY